MRDEVSLYLLVGRLKLLRQLAGVDAAERDGLLELYLELCGAVGLDAHGAPLLGHKRHRRPLLAELLLDLISDGLLLGHEPDLLEVFEVLVGQLCVLGVFEVGVDLFLLRLVVFGLGVRILALLLDVHLCDDEHLHRFELALHLGLVGDALRASLGGDGQNLLDVFGELLALLGAGGEARAVGRPERLGDH